MKSNTRNVIKFISRRIIDNMRNDAENYRRLPFNIPTHNKRFYFGLIEGCRIEPIAL